MATNSSNSDNDDDVLQTMSGLQLPLVTVMMIVILMIVMMKTMMMMIMFDKLAKRRLPLLASG